MHMEVTGQPVGVDSFFLSGLLRWDDDDDDGGWQ